jgi:small subunit ribosomal protein S16
MLKIRLQRIGRKNEPAFRLVVTDSKNAAQSGKFLEILGTHTVKSDAVSFKKDRILHWIKNGAQVSDTAHNMLVKQGVIEGKKKNVLSKKSPTVKRKELKKK